MVTTNTLYSPSLPSIHESFRNNYLSEYHHSDIQGLQPARGYPYYKDPQNSSSKSYVLNHFSVSTTHFNPLFYFNPPPFLHSPCSPPSQTTFYSDIHPVSSSFYTFQILPLSFNFSHFIFVNFHVFFFCIIIPISQYLTIQPPLFFNCSFQHIIPLTHF